MQISPMAQVALLQTEMNSGFRLVPRMGMNSAMQGLTCTKQALVRSPSRAKELCRTSGMVSCMHWKSSVMMLLRATSCSTWQPSPSARPLSRSSATIMKSLSGASYWSGCWLYIMAWASVFCTRVTQRW